MLASGEPPSASVEPDAQARSRLFTRFVRTSRRLESTPGGVKFPYAAEFRARSLRFGHRQTDHVVRRSRRRLYATVDNIEAAFVSERLECLCQADHRLRCAQHQKSVFRHLPRDAIEHGSLVLLVEIDQHIPAEHHVELAEHG